MFTRLMLAELREWSDQTNRKPLVIRGARQVGKTTLVNQFAQQFDQYLYFNLELETDRAPFEKFTSIDILLQALFFLKNKSLALKHKTLLFIDEIQEVPRALNILRYFFENEPTIAVIAAGSLLESLFDKNIHFPVGRVEYKVVRPVSFPEYLDAMGENSALSHLTQIPLEPYTHQLLLRHFHSYALIGGMPEVVNHYIQNKDLSALSKIYDSLITAYLDDVEKYAGSASQILHIRHAMQVSFLQAGKRIKFEGFGQSNYRSREMGEALRILEKAMLLQLIYPTSSVLLPLLPDIKKSPRLQVLDTGLLNYMAGIQKEIIGTTDLHSIYQGLLIEHLAGQELLTIQHRSLNKLHFWTREKKGSSAEVDFVLPYQGKLIPIEIKSGSEGTLKSLHLFMDAAPHTIAIRFYAAELNTTTVQTANGKKYSLLSLPYYLISQTEKYLDWFQPQIKD